MAALTAKTSRTRAYATFVLTALTVVACAALMTAAALTPAPVTVLPLAVIICIGCPMVMAWSLPGSLAALRAHKPGHAPHDEHALRALKLQLARLPETEHPLGL